MACYLFTARWSFLYLFILFGLINPNAAALSLCAILTQHWRASCLGMYPDRYLRHLLPAEWDYLAQCISIALLMAITSFIALVYFTDRAAHDKRSGCSGESIGRHVTH